MKRFLSFAFWAFPFFAIGQTPKPAEPKGPAFPENPAEFIGKLGEFVTLSHRPDCEEAMKVFEKNWKANLFSAGEQTAIISATNKMADAKIGAHPYFKDYLNALAAVKKQSDTTIFSKWHPLVVSVVGDLERGKNKPLENFLEFSVDFFDSRLLRKGTGGSVSWSAEGGRTKFGYAQKRPFVQLEGANLHGYLKKDSISIRNASGTFFPVEQEFEGQWAKVPWRGKGTDTTVYAQLAGFKIDVTKTGYSLPKANFYHPTYFPGKSLEGKFEDKVVVENKAVENSYPRFESADKRLFIENVGDGIRMLGGFRIEGSSVFGFGSVREKAQMWMNELQNDKNLLIHGQAVLFIIKRGEKVFSEKTTVAIYPGGLADSLFHPSVGMQIDLKKSVVQLYRGKASDERTPFFNSFFNMNVDAERLAWYMESDSLLVGAKVGAVSGSKERAIFESSQFYSENEYLRLQNSASYNPVAMLFLMWRDGGEKTLIPAIQFAQKINPKWNTSNVQKIISEMVEQGFINYYTDTEEIEIKQKLLHYARAAQGKTDFDNIKLRSESEKPNAVMDAKSQEAKVDAVQSVEFSAKQKTAVKPYDDKITLLKDRDMRFGGKLYSGYAVFEGQKMEFDYEQFQINLDSCRYLDFYIPSPDEKDKAGNPVAKSIASTVEYVTGAVLIDAPNNKSGKEDLKIFPSFQAK